VQLNQEITMAGTLNLLSQNIQAEYFYRDLLNLLFGYNLVNENEFDQNSDAIDLIDYENKIVVQVSSTCTKFKMDSTLKKMRIEKLAQENYSLKFAFIGEQNSKSKRWRPQNPHQIKFTPEKDILFTQDLSRRFLSLTIEDQETIISFLYRETGKKFKLTRTLIDTQLAESIHSLGPRYSPKVNVDTDNNLVFDSILQTKQFWASASRLIDKLIAAICVVRSDKYEILEAQQFVDEFCSLTAEQYDLLKSYDNKLVDDDKSILLINICGSLEEILSNCDTFPILTGNLDFQARNEIVSSFRAIENAVSSLREFFDQTKIETLLNPYLLIYGEAGIGKSHLLADFCSKARNDGHLVFLSLGQHFVSDEDPWVQIIKSIAPQTSLEEFFDEVSRYTELYSKKAIIVIDALNEGEGRRLWPKYFQRFFERISNNKHICFVFSVRSTYLDEIIPDYTLIENNISKYKHIGFENYEFDAINTYCAFYNLLPPAFPMLNEEFQNPLFLKLVCSMLQNKGVTRLERGYSLYDVYSSYLQEINKKLAAVDYLNYDSRINLVQIVIYALISEIHKVPYGQLDYHSAYLIVKKTASEYSEKAQAFLIALIDQNILQEDSNYRDEKVISFTYEKLGDYYHADWLLEKYKDYQSDNLLSNIKSDSEITKYLTDASKMSFNNGIIEMLSVLLPQKLGFELFEVVPSNMKSKSYIVEAFLNSLYWRKVSYLELSQKDFINKIIFKNVYYLQKFINVLIDLSFDCTSAFNAKALDKVLKKMPLNSRDAYWTTYISVNYTASKVEKYVLWVWNNYIDLPPNSIELIEITLLWFLSSTNRRIRDYSTKALSCLLIQHPESASSLLLNSSEIDDPYILERMYAALFGAIVHNSKESIWANAVLLVYDKVFNQKETLPNIMIRDYAKCIIEFAINNSIIEKADVPRMYQPYNSIWYPKLTNLEEIDNFQIATDEKYKEYGKESIAVYRIIHSMTTEYGRGTGAYGDFGRYTFGATLHEWNNQFDDQDLSNIVTKQIFEKYYDVKLHSDFDYSLGGHFDRHDHRVERLGKKYQWIGLFELLARLVDNYPPYKENIIYKPEFEEIREQRRKDFLALILQEDLLEGYSKLDKSENEQAKIIENEEGDNLEDENNKYVERVEKETILNYENPWKYYLRDIDPSFIWNKIATRNNSLLPDFWATPIGLEWVNNSLIYDELNLYREFLIDGKKFISLYSYLHNVKNPDAEFETRDAVTFLSGSFIISLDEKATFLEKKDLMMGNGIPTLSYSNCFLYEHHWSSTCHAQSEEYDIDYDLKMNFFIGTNSYLWEPSQDESLPENESVNVVLPNEKLVNYFKLHQDGLGVWKDDELEVVCFDSAQLGYSEQLLLFDKERLFQYLNNNNLTIVWGEYLEKISTSHHHEWRFKTDYDDGNYTKCIIDETKWGK
jgi:hypothetical protein